MIKGILEGIACVAFGVLIFYNTYKYPVEGKYNILLPNFSGYMGDCFCYNGNIVAYWLFLPRPQKY